MDPRLLKYAERSAPRYTSYPTAPHFGPEVDGRLLARWLGELDPDAELSLYLHVPFCDHMCWYCACHAYSVHRDKPIADYVETLLAEIALTASAAASRSVTEIHWGGGTPNILSPERFLSIQAALAKHFDLSKLRRHAMEIDPRRLTEEQASALVSAGVDRVSLGVQDLDEAVQQGIGRIQPYEVVESAVGMLRKAGIGALSFDLMYGLPGQTIRSVTETARRAAELAPARVSVFGYAHVPWFKSRQRLMNESMLPGPEQRFDLAEAIRETLHDAGYVAVGYDHYALPDDPLATASQQGGLRRNFQGFVEAKCDALIGLGPSAISTLPSGYAQNEPEIGGWRSRIAAGQLATKRGRALTEDDKTRREIIMRLLCDFMVDLADFGGRACFTDELNRLAPLVQDGLVRVEGDLLQVPAEARPFARLVAEAFDAYQGVGEARHSRAV